MLFAVQKSTLSFPDRAPLKIRVDVTVKSTPTQIWNVLMDHPKWVEWYEGVTSCEDTSPPGKEGLPGSSRRVMVNGLQSQEEFIALVPGKIWAFSVFETNAPLCHKWVERLVLEPTQEGGTHIIYEAGLELRWLGKLLQPTIVKAIKDAWGKSLGRLDAYIERISQK
jgi:hypothetical protein